MSPLDSLRSPFMRRDWVRVKAGVATAIPAHSVVLITASTITNGEIVYTVRQPNAASTDFNWSGYLITGPFAIDASTSYEGIATDASTPALASYDTGSPALKEVWGPKHSQFTLSKNYYGFEVVGSTTTSAGINVVPVRWIGIGTVLGKIDNSSVSVGSSCTVSVWAGAGGSEGDTTMNITGVYNRGTSLTSLSSPYCMVSRNGGVPYLIWVAC